MDEYPELRLENQLCFPLYAASRQVIKQYTPLLERIDLTYTQYVAMMVLWDAREISAKDLGKKLYLDSGTLTPVLKSLEAKGYIVRRRSEEDERVLMVHLSDEGLALREKAAAIPEQVACTIKLAPDEAAELYSLLYKLLGSIE